MLEETERCKSGDTERSERRWVMAKIAKRGGARVIRRSAHEIWLAGLGALTLAEEEGTKLFKMLVKRGAEMETHNRERLEKLIAKVKPLREDAGVALQKVGAGMDNRMAAVLHRLGVPTRREIQGLSRRVEQLTHSLERRRPRQRKRAHQ
jgi:poly(hydroxyalkanoate) granule-associated protein